MTVITQLPTPPSRAVPSQFSTRCDGLLGALPAFVTETNAVASEVNADKTTAVNSAATAVTKAAEATASASAAVIAGTSEKWVSGASYTIGQGVWSPVDYLPYRRLTDGAGTTDPSADATNWKPLPPVPMVRVERTSNVEITSANRGYFFDITSGTFSQTFSSKEVLGNGFYCYILNSGTGVVTVDPGGLDYALYQKHSLLVQCDGTELRIVIDSGQRQVRLPIFSTEAASRTGVSVLEDITLPVRSTLLGGTVVLEYGNNLFIASRLSSSSNISTSPDGVTWTLRAMPASRTWFVGTNGTDRFIATAPGVVNTANSTDGITWTSSTSLPGIPDSNYGKPVFNGNICLVPSSTSNLCYTSSDNGATWSAAQTIPIDMSFFAFAIGGLFWVFNNSDGSTAYTSPTGATGSWTARELPVAIRNAYKTHDGKLCIEPYSYGNYYYESTDGINWTSIGITKRADLFGSGTVLNGVRAWISSTFPHSKTYHNGTYVQRISSVSVDPSYRSVYTNGSVILFPAVGSSGGIALFNTASTTPTAIFEG